jgi:hypothetical protein
MSSVIPAWAPTTAYIPGALVVPKSTAIVTNEQPNNNNFADGLTHWNIATGEDGTPAGGSVTADSGNNFGGGESVTFVGSAGGTGSRGSMVALAINDYSAPVTPGQVINFQGYILRNFTNANTAYVAGGVRIAWYNSSHEFLSYSYAQTAGGVPPESQGMLGGASNYPNWMKSYGQGVAPSGAAYAVAVFALACDDTGSSQVWGADYTWDYQFKGLPTGLVFVAVQPATGTSGTTEPTWPVSEGVTVVDNTVTWEAEYATQITWEAESILKSGADEPTWPDTVGAQVVDNSIVWVAVDGLITDTNCPNSKVVTIASAKIYAVDSTDGNNIIRFSATTNPLDWTASNDAGFIPFGLQQYGSEPCAALGLYRSNLVAFNSLGYQMWQVDADPANIAILDAEPVGCNYSKTGQPDNNDYVFLSPVGIRNIGTSGASGNLQAGTFGKAVDPLVQALINALPTTGYEPRSLYDPGTGQYWLLVGPDAIVLTINGNSDMSWSRYRFPDVITDSTVLNGVLYLRTAGNLVWEMSAQALDDDVQVTTATGGDNIGFQGYMAWEYLELGSIGIDKEMEGFDITIGQIDDEGILVPNTCQVDITFGYNQSNRQVATTPYTITGDTIPGTMTPFPLIFQSVQVRLDFGTGQDWGWGATNLYMFPLRKP